MPLKLINTSDRELQLIQDNVSAAIIPIERYPLAGGVLLSNVTVRSGQANLIAHSLGRMPSILLLGVPSTQSTVWCPTKTSTNLDLRSSADCVVSIWVN